MYAYGSVWLFTRVTGAVSVTLCYLCRQHGSAAIQGFYSESSDAHCKLCGCAAWGSYIPADHSLRRSHTGRHCTCKVVHTTAVPAVHGSIPQTLPCIGVLYYVRTDVRMCVLLPAILSVPMVLVHSCQCSVCPCSFLHGLCDARLPDTYTWLGCGIHSHVLSTQKVLDLFSPFLLALPPTLPPMRSTSSPEGGGGMWSKAPLFQLDRGQASCSAAGVNSHWTHMQAVL